MRTTAHAIPMSAYPAFRPRIVGIESESINRVVVPAAATVQHVAIVHRRVHNLVLQKLREGPLETGQPFGACCIPKGCDRFLPLGAGRLAYRFSPTAMITQPRADALALLLACGSAITWRENSHLACSVSYLAHTQNCDTLPANYVVIERNVNA